MEGGPAGAPAPAADSVERQWTATSAVLYSYWAGPVADGYEFLYRPGRTAGLVPTNGGETCVWAAA